MMAFFFYMSASAQTSIFRRTARHVKECISSGRSQMHVLTTSSSLLSHYLLVTLYEVSLCMHRVRKGVAACLSLPRFPRLT